MRILLHISIFYIADGTEKKIGSYLVYNEFQANTITSSLFMTASAPNVAAIGLAAANGVHVSWFGWLLAAIVPGLIALIVVPFILYKLYLPEIKETPNAKSWAEGQLAEMGQMKLSEKLMLAIFILSLVLWMVSSFVPAVNATWVAFLATALLLLSGILTTKDILNENGAWNVVIWFSILIFMASQLSKPGGVIPWLQGTIKHAIGGMSPMIVMAILVLYGLVGGLWMKSYWFIEDSSERALIVFRSRLFALLIVITIYGVQK